MGLFYKASPKELLQIRKNIFLEKGIPALNKNGFKKSPFSTADFGWHPPFGYFYQLCRLSDSAFLEFVDVHIIRGDRWIQIYLNVFKLTPHVESLEQLNGVGGLQFRLPPNSITEMRLHGADGIKGIPLFNYDFMANHHMLKSYFTKNGFKRRINELSNSIEKDLTNIDYFLNRWHKVHKPIVTNWEGKIEGLDGMTVNERLVASGLMKLFDATKKRDKARAKQILEWLKVDELSIEQILK